jgi:ABC-2 type transport system ATP-binding protein
VVVVLGPNGSGKTTLLKIISTMLLPDRGRVIIAGADASIHAGRVRCHVGFAVASERSFFARLTGRENLEFFAALEEVPRAQRSERVASVLRVTGLDEAADRLAMKFSSGMYQKLGIARALLKNPSVLLLDEPSRSLDPGATARLWETVRQSSAQGVTVILTTHHFEEAAAVADEVVLLHRGSIMARQQVSSPTSAAQVRAFYFDHVGEAEAVLAAAGGGGA